MLATSEKIFRTYLSSFTYKAMVKPISLTLIVKKKQGLANFVEFKYIYTIPLTRLWLNFYL